MKDRKKPEKFWLPHGMPSDDRAFAFSSRVFPKASQIKALYKLWHYQLKRQRLPLSSSRCSSCGTVHTSLQASEQRSNRLKPPLGRCPRRQKLARTANFCEKSQYFFVLVESMPAANL